MINLAKRLIDSSLRAVDPYELINNYVKLMNNVLIVDEKYEYYLDKFSHIYLIGFGKGVAPMAEAVEELLGERLSESRIVIKYGHGKELRQTDIYEAGHPIPDENTLSGTAKLLELVEAATEDDLVIVLITGGGSALLELLPEGIKLDDLAELNSLLLNSGATITEINTIRKHLSQVKGGRLAQRIAPANGFSLILSDVIGDPLESIASGPTAPDPTTFKQAFDILKRYNLLEKVPNKVIEIIKQGLEGSIPETPNNGDLVFHSFKNLIIGNNRLAAMTISSEAKRSGYQTIALTDRVEGEARELGILIGGMIKSALHSGLPFDPPGCLVMGGEPTVTIKGKGKGGRNQELALAVLRAVQNEEKPFYFCSLGTDGTDGPTDAAGAWIDHLTMRRVREKSLDIDQYLDNNDAYHFFEAIDQLIKTGPTRTNVMDVQFFLV